jgi:hypothetical protein
VKSGAPRRHQTREHRAIRRDRAGAALVAVRHGSPCTTAHHVSPSARLSNSHSTLVHQWQHVIPCHPAHIAPQERGQYEQSLVFLALPGDGGQPGPRTWPARGGTAGGGVHPARDCRRVGPAMVGCCHGAPHVAPGVVRPWPSNDTYLSHHGSSMESARSLSYETRDFRTARVRHHDQSEGQVIGGIPTPSLCQ